MKVHNFSRYAQYLRFAKDDQEIVSSDQYHEVCVTQIASLKKSCTMMKEKLSEGEAIFPSPDGNILATRSHEGVVRLWNARSFTPIGNPLAERLNGSLRLRFSSDGQTFAGGCGFMSRALCLVDIGSPLTPRVKVVPDSSGVGDVAFGWDDKMIATAGGERLIWLWDLTPEPRKHPEPLRGHIGEIRDVMFSPNGKLLSSVAYSDGPIRLWDVEKSGVFDAALKGNRTTVTAMAFSGDSKIFVSGADDGLIVLWDLSETSWRETACRMANRNLTNDEWSQYVGDSKPFELLCPP